MSSTKGQLIEAGQLAAAWVYQNPRNRYRPPRVAWKGTWAGEQALAGGATPIRLAGWEGLAQLHALELEPEQAMRAMIEYLEAGVDPNGVIFPLGPYYSGGPYRIIGYWEAIPDWSQAVRLLPPAAKALAYTPNVELAVNLLETFTAKGGDLYAPVGSVDGYPVPLIFALAEHKLSPAIAEELIARGLLNPSYRDRYGRNILHAAPPVALAKLLISYGANPADVAELPREELALLRLRGDEVPWWHGKAAGSLSGN